MQAMSAIADRSCALHMSRGLVEVSSLSWEDLVLPALLMRRISTTTAFATAKRVALLICRDVSAIPTHSAKTEPRASASLVFMDLKRPQDQSQDALDFILIVSISISLFISPAVCRCVEKVGGDAI